MDCASAEDEAEVQESQHFDDFTLASSWERFISEIEAVCRCWLADGPKNLLGKDAVHVQTSKKLRKAKYELKYNKKIYCMEYYFEEKCRSKVVNWDCGLDDLQLAFGVSEFLIIAPKSASGVILDSPEASKLLSAVAIALSNSCSRWPAFVPVHDPSRKAYIGIQNMGTVFTRRFESDCIKSQVPIKLMHLEGLYELFVSKFAFSTLDLSLQLFRVQFTMKLTYRTLSFNDDDDHMSEAETENIGSSADFNGDRHNRSQWDDDCPWSEWYSAEDPVKGFQLITIWSERTLESSLEMAEIENSSPQEAESWLLLPFLGILNDDHKAKEVGFASQLSLLVDALETSFAAQFLEDFVSVESSAETLRSSAAVPPPTVVDRVLKELFREALEVVDFDKSEHRSSRAIKGAPLGSLFAQFCLHSLWFGNCNIRAIAMLWIEFVREVRWCWEESQPLPKIPANGVIDLSFCLIHQKLQMLAMCIEKKREVDEEFSHPIGDKYEQSGHRQEDLLCKTGATGSWNEDNSSKGGQDVSCDAGETTENTNALEMASDRIRRGSAGIAGSMMLLNSRQRIHVPFTQDAPPMTEDMHEERLNAVAAFGDSFNLSAQLEREILQSDMSAFKAANPDAVFEDFIRWHSPGDWESDTIEDSSVSGTKMNDDWRPRGRLSSRMFEHGNFWRKLWNDAPALTASEQKPLFDANREGEKILHYLETLRPRQLLEQMVCTSFRATAETLNQTTFGNVDLMKSKLDQLCLTMASALRPLQGSQLSQDSEVFEDLKQLCATFRNTERFTILAASLHRKFIRSPRLSREIFADYNNFCLLKVGNGAVEDDIPKEFEQKQEVRIEERNVVADLFVPPSANQSWRKVISMGNLLNGHEPELREIIFGMREEVNGSYYTGHSPVDVDTQRDIETYRMYVRGTSNDLGVALSVVSYD